MQGLVWGLVLGFRVTQGAGAGFRCLVFGFLITRATQHIITGFLPSLVIISAIISHHGLAAVRISSVR